jgi:hypothetical protein
VPTPPDQPTDLVGRYADAVLRFDAERFAALWTTDAEWVVAGGEPLRGRTLIVETFVRARSGFSLCVQEIMSGYVDRPTGADRTAHWQVRELQWRPDGRGSQLIGVYHDDIRAVEESWCFARRRFELLYRGPLDVSGRLYLPPPDA